MRNNENLCFLEQKNNNKKKNSSGFIVTKEVKSSDWNFIFINLWGIA